jgi:hypothetical protein
MSFLPGSSGGSAMNIKSIAPTPISPVILRTADGSNARADVWTGAYSERSTCVPSGSSASTSAAQSSTVQRQALINRIDYIKEQLDKVLVDFPPFFPPGTYQRVDLIKGIRNIQAEIEKSAFAGAMKKDTSSWKLTEDATDHEISAALDKLFGFRDEMAESISGGFRNLEPGSMLNIKV